MISGTNNYNESLTYDLRGNIQTLQRTGFYTNGGTCTYGQIDNLTYSYPSSPASNKVHKILDGTTTAGDAKSRGFNGLLSTTDNSLTYDANGNLNKNLHKNISSIAYNHLNLPKLITFSTGNTIEFLYDAVGNKLRKTTKTGATVQYVQDYFPGGIEYRQTGIGPKRVESVYHAEGRYYNTNVDASNTIVWRKEYSFKDYLGNTRLAFTDRNANGIVDITGTASTSDILQENHYYAFGLAFEGAWLQNDAGVRDNKYGYNSKELNDDFGLNWSDYGARWYDAAIGRWNAVDPMAGERNWATPFNYVQNSPINRIDPFGALDTLPDGRKLWELSSYELELIYGKPFETEVESDFRQMNRESMGIPNNVSVSFAEALWYFGEYFGLVSPSAKIKFPRVKPVGANAQAVDAVETIAKKLSPLDEDDAITLFRGLTGSEKDGKASLFLTDSYKVARSYVKNGGEVAEYTLSRVKLKQLEFQDKLTLLTGKHGPTGVTSTEYKFLGVDLKKAINTLAKSTKKP